MWLTLSWKFIGGLGVFFFGMKSLSEAFQAISGSFVHRLLRTLTNRPLIGAGVGAFVTTLIQSSSVTTVILVGLANANLISLTQAIGVIFGANIGTTITGWIIAIKIGKYGPLFVGLGIFPYLFSKRETIRSVAKIFISVGFVFMGLELMGTAFKPLRTNSGFMELLAHFSADSYASLLACVLMGALLTCVIQSSSAMLGITIALAMTGSISYQTAIALVLGENIGTTITALLASVGANVHARRAARAHALFNVGGVIWMLPIFWVFLRAVDWLTPGMPDFLAADGSKPFVAAHIAGAHTLFNVANALLFLPFVKPFARFVVWMTPEPDDKDRSPAANLLEGGPIPEGAV